MFESQYGDFDIQQTHINAKGLLVVSSGETNLGIIGQSDVRAKVFSAGTITVDMFGYAHYRGHDYKMVTHARVFSLSLITKKNLTREIGLYFAAQFGFFKKIFSYNDMASWKKIKDIKITLPVTENGNPDYEYMSRFIRIRQKLAIKNVVEWKERELKTYRDVVGK
ncbi:MAG: restriction endonuclease subunit S [Chitinivibrionia bacterium]|nr:restriction endonuclease subunit S [Chitinivibrionia bacterium]